MSGKTRVGRRDRYWEILEARKGWPAATWTETSGGEGEWREGEGDETPDGECIQAALAELARRRAGG